MCFGWQVVVRCYDDVGTIHFVCYSMVYHWLARVQARVPTTRNERKSTFFFFGHLFIQKWPGKFFHRSLSNHVGFISLFEHKQCRNTSNSSKTRKSHRNFRFKAWQTKSHLLAVARIRLPYLHLIDCCRLHPLLVNHHLIVCCLCNLPIFFGVFFVFVYRLFLLLFVSFVHFIIIYTTTLHTRNA